MTLLHFDGFDIGDLLMQDYVLGDGGVSLATSTPFGVGRSMQMNSSYLGKNIVPTAEVYSGFWMQYYGGGTNNQGAFYQVVGDAGTIAHISVGCTVSGVYARLGGATGTIITPVGPWVFPNSPYWRHVQVYVKVADSGGRVVIKVDDSIVVDFTGDTRNGGAGTIDQVRLIRGTGEAAFWHDDWWITDPAGSAPLNGFLGMARCRLQSPTGAGASTAFTPSTAPNWDCVNEQPSVTTDYVSNPGPVAGTRDTYAVADIPSAGVDVLAVKSLSVAKKTGPGVISLKPVVRSGGADAYATAVPLPGADRSVAGVWVTDPATGVAWTAAGVNAAEVGFEVA